MILSDRDLKERLAKGDLVFKPLEDPEHTISPASIDFRLGDRFTVFKASEKSLIDPMDYDDKCREEFQLASGRKMIRHDYTDVFEGGNEPFMIHPGDFVLGKVHEYLEIPADLACTVNGRSSLGRIGLIINSTAGWVDPGFRGHITLEITNIGRLPIKLYPGMRVGQFVFHQLNSPSEKPYNVREQSKYRDEQGATQSRLGMDKELQKQQ